ncbi:protein kinase [bacterium]|nr:protein kinase [bacterium]
MNMNPSALLKGKILNNEWEVTSRHPRIITKSNFSYGYDVKNIDSGKEAFCKAIDLGHILQDDEDVMGKLQEVTQAYQYEKALVIKCSDRNMKRILKVLDHGEVRIKDYPAYPVPFLIFEKADSDVEELHLLSDNFDTAWKFRSLHHIAVGLSELHFNNIFHMDLKPSNVFNMGDKETKIGDLGRSLDNESTAKPYYSTDIHCGAFWNAPPEIIYNIHDDNIDICRRSIELYHLGSMCTFYFYGLGMTQSVLSKLPDIAIPSPSISVSLDDAMQMWRKYWNHVLIEIEEYYEDLPKQLHEQFFTALKELTEPEYKKRGRKRLLGKSGVQYSVAPYVGVFNTLAYRAEQILLEGR